MIFEIDQHIYLILYLHLASPPPIVKRVVERVRAKANTAQLFAPFVLVVLVLLSVAYLCMPILFIQKLWLKEIK